MRGGAPPRRTTRPPYYYFSPGRGRRAGDSARTGRARSLLSCADPRARRSKMRSADCARVISHCASFPGRARVDDSAWEPRGVGARPELKVGIKLGRATYFISCAIKSLSLAPGCLGSRESSYARPAVRGGGGNARRANKGGIYSLIVYYYIGAAKYTP